LQKVCDVAVCRGSRKRHAISLCAPKQMAITYLMSIPCMLKVASISWNAFLTSTNTLLMSVSEISQSTYRVF
jgi:hypothetical protein